MTSHLSKLGHCGCRAEVQREAASILHRVDADDGTGAPGMQGRHREQSDGTEADDHDRIAGVDSSALNGVDRHRQRLDETGVLERQRGRKAVQQLSGHRDHFGKTAVAGKTDAGGERHRAAIGGAGTAVVADAAGQLWVDDRAVAGRPPDDTVANRIDDSGELVTRDRVGEEPHLVRRQIRAADAAPVDPDHHLPGHRLRRRHVHELEVVGLDEPDRSHVRLHQPELRDHAEHSEMTARVGRARRSRCRRRCRGTARGRPPDHRGARRAHHGLPALRRDGRSGSPGACWQRGAPARRARPARSGRHPTRRCSRRPPSPGACGAPRWPPPWR